MISNGLDSQNDDNEDDQFLSSRRGYRQLKYTIREGSSDADDAVFKGFTSHVPKASGRKADVDMEDTQYDLEHEDPSVGNAAIAGEDDTFDILPQSPLARTSPSVISAHSLAAIDPNLKQDPRTHEAQQGGRFIEESDASGSDYEETVAIANMRRQERLRHRDLTPTMEEQDEMDDEGLLAEENTPHPRRFTASQRNKGRARVVVNNSSGAEDEGDTSPPQRFTASQKNKGRARVVDNNSSGAEDDDTSPTRHFTASQKNKGRAHVIDNNSSGVEDEGEIGEDEGDHNEEPNGEPLVVESLEKFVNKKAKDATDVARLLQMVPSRKAKPDNKDSDSQHSSGNYTPKLPKEKLAQSRSNNNGAFESMDKDEGDDEQEATRHKSGPLPKAAKEAAFAAHQEYRDKLEALASEYDKPLKLFLRLVAQEVKSSHRLNPWSAFQHWYSRHGDVKKTKEGVYCNAHVLPTVNY